MIILVHHADAVLPDVDSSRPLSPRGREAAQALAQEALRRGVKPEVIWHSGKLRARQTAEMFWRICHPFATCSAERGLQPSDPPEWVRDRLVGEERSVLIVGHLPNIARLYRLMAGEDPDASLLTFPLHGLVMLRSADDGWCEEDRVEPSGGAAPR